MEVRSLEDWSKRRSVASPTNPGRAVLLMAIMARTYEDVLRLKEDSGLYRRLFPDWRCGFAGESCGPSCIVMRKAGDRLCCLAAAMSGRCPAGHGLVGIVLSRPWLRRRGEDGGLFAGHGTVLFRSE